MYSLLSKEQLDEMWSYKAGDWYKNVNPDKEWLECTSCGVLPRLWEFNNGSYAKCLCYGRYDTPPVRNESVLSVYSRTGLTAEYCSDNLRLTWNLFAKDGVERNKLEVGKW